jgi:hypothetical protein
MPTNASRVVHHFNVTTTPITLSLLQGIKAAYSFTSDTFLTTKNMWDPTEPQGDIDIDQNFNKITFKQAIFAGATATIYVSMELDPMKSINPVTTSNAAPSGSSGYGFIPLTFAQNLVNQTYTFYGQFDRLRMIAASVACMTTVILERV